MTVLIMVAVVTIVLIKSELTTVTTFRALWNVHTLRCNFRMPRCKEQAWWLHICVWTAPVQSSYIFNSHIMEPMRMIFLTDLCRFCMLGLTNSQADSGHKNLIHFVSAQITNWIVGRSKIVTFSLKLFSDFSREFIVFWLSYVPTHQLCPIKNCSYSKLNSVALVRKRTIPTERPPLSAK
jgi:hypothetical protein